MSATIRRIIRLGTAQPGVPEFLFMGLSVSAPQNDPIPWTLQARDLTWNLRDREADLLLPPRPATWTLEDIYR